MILKAAIYDPYLDTLGGGERYCLSVAEILKQNHYQVDIFWSGDSSILKKAEDRFSLDLSNLNLIPNIFTSKNIWQKYNLTKKYHVIFYLSDGSLPLLFAKHNLLHFQVPFNPKQKFQQKLINYAKVRCFSHLICNSNFTASFIKSYLHYPTTVLYPPVDIQKFIGQKTAKSNFILSVGRFDNLLNAKKQDILIKAFKKLHHSPLTSDWKLVLAGGSLSNPQNNSYLKQLQLLAKNYPVEFVVNPNFTDLRQLYLQSKIYWHAAGYGVDENKNPQNTEHFGMSTVEAMASSSIPVVVAVGGLKEIIVDGQNGFLWRQPEELVHKTLGLISSPEKIKNISHLAVKSSYQFSKENFQKKFLSLIKT